MMWESIQAVNTVETLRQIRLRQLQLLCHRIGSNLMRAMEVMRLPLERAVEAVRSWATTIVTSDAFRVLAEYCEIRNIQDDIRSSWWLPAEGA